MGGCPCHCKTAGTGLWGSPSAQLFTNEKTKAQRMTIRGPRAARTNDHTWGFKTTGIYPLQVWRPEVQDQDVTRPCSIWGLQERVLPSPSSCWCPRCPWACGYITLSLPLSSRGHLPTSVSQILPSFLYKDPCHWIQSPPNPGLSHLEII